MQRQLPACLNPHFEGARWSPPLDIRDLVVRLETSGITDAVARLDFSHAGTWELAQSHLHRLQQIPATPPEPEPPASLLVEYLRGISFAFPLALCCAAMLLLKFSVWGGDVAADVAAAIGLGTVSSFVVTGGLIQVMARRTLFFAGVEQFLASRNCCRRWLRYSLPVLAASGILLLVCGNYFRWLPTPVIWIAVLFHICLGLFWLSAGILYTLESYRWIAASALIGIAVVAALHLGAGMRLLVAQPIGIIATAAFSLLIGYGKIARRARQNQGSGSRQTLARDAYYAWSYFVYGCLYYLFLFADRLVAWTATGPASALAIGFRGSYETAMDIALFAFVLQAGWVHTSLVRFFGALEPAQRQYGVEGAAQFNRLMCRRYLRHCLALIPITLGSAVAALAAAGYFGFLQQPILKMCLWALVGFPFLSIGLWNVNLLFRLACPNAVLKPLLWSLAANLVSGYLLSRLFSYQYAVCGFTIGAVCFGVLAGLQGYRRLQHLDYYYYSSSS